jgi:hypothetical protein
MALPESLKLRMSGVPGKRKSPLWAGPSSPGPLGGVTFSMLSRFLVCRERFRIHYLEGLRPNPQFNHRMEYGQMWHECEEAHAAGTSWTDKLLAYAREMVKKYPMAREQINHWYSVCLKQFPLYVKHWEENPDVLNRTPLEQERVFDVDYQLPSGRVVRLRGKRDSVDTITDEDGIAGIYLAENKSKGDIDEVKMLRQLTFDLQTMMYLTVMYQEYEDSNVPIRGVRYNVVRRPLSGGKGSIVQGKGTPGGPCSACKGTGRTPAGTKECSKCGGVGQLAGKPGETSEAYYSRMAKYIEEEPGHFFMRWKVEVSEADVRLFRNTCLDPILETLCYWYDWVMDRAHPISRPYSVNMWNWRHPFGVYNSLDEGGSTDLDEYLLNGNEVGLTRVNSLFEELQ